MSKSSIVYKYGVCNFIIIVSLLMTPVSFSKGTYDGGGGLVASGNIFRLLFAAAAVGLVLLKLIKAGCFKIVIPKGGVIKFFLLYWILGSASFVSSYWISYSVMKYIEYGVLILVSVYLSIIASKKDNKIFQWAFDIALLFVKIMVFIVLLGFIISPSRALLIPDKFNATSEAILPFQLQGWILPLSNTAVCFYAGYTLFATLVKYMETNEKKVGYLFEIAIYGFVAILAMSRMALIGTLVACFAYLFLFKRNSKMKLILILSGLIIILFAGKYIVTFMLRGQTTEEVWSVTGRTKWWLHALKVYSNGSLWEKLFGFGFAAGEKAVARQSSTLMYTLDSDFFANLISTGAVGIACMFGVIWRSIRQLSAVRRISDNISVKDRIYIFQASGIMIITLLRLFTVTTFSLLSTYLSLFVFASMTIDYIQHGRTGKE